VLDRCSVPSIITGPSRKAVLKLQRSQTASLQTQLATLMAVDIRCLLLLRGRAIASPLIGMSADRNSILFILPVIPNTRIDRQRRDTIDTVMYQTLCLSHLSTIQTRVGSSRVNRSHHLLQRHLPSTSHIVAHMSATFRLVQHDHTAMCPY
ncbi:MAG: hypothetical protein J07HQX50_01742, partial [Haloquadratum sp. J07HQX50]